VANPQAWTQVFVAPGKSGGGAGAAIGGPAAPAAQSAAEILIATAALWTNVEKDFKDKATKAALIKDVTKVSFWKSLLPDDAAASRLTSANEKLEKLKSAIDSTASKEAGANYFAYQMASEAQKTMVDGLKPDAIQEPKCWLAGAVAVLDRHCRDTGVVDNFSARFVAALLGVSKLHVVVPATMVPEPVLVDGGVNPKAESAVAMFAALVRIGTTREHGGSFPTTTTGFEWLERQLTNKPSNGATTAASITAFLGVAGAALNAKDPTRFGGIVEQLRGYVGVIMEAGAASADEKDKAVTVTACATLNGILASGGAPAEHSNFA
jgi:hypothetical protein